MPVLVNFGNGTIWLLWSTLYVQISDPADLTAVKAAFQGIKTWTCDSAQHQALLAATHTTVAGTLTLGGTVSVA